MHPKPGTPVRHAALPRRLSLLPAILSLFILPAAALSAQAAQAAQSGYSGHSDQSGRTASCADMLDSLDRLHEADRPEYLAWDFAVFGCAKDQLYRAYLRQGFGSLLASDWQGAALNLRHARDIGGPDDEELLYHLWTAWRRLGARAEMRAAARELLDRFPASPYLERILEEGRDAGGSFLPRRWKASFESRLARSRTASLDQDVSNRLKGGIGQEAGGHVFRESAALSLKGNLGRRALEGFQADLGADWRSGGFSVDADWGIAYDARNVQDTSASALSGSGSGAGRAGWNGLERVQAGLGAGWTGSLPGGPDLSVRAGLRLLSGDWWSAGAAVSPSWGSGAWTLTALVDARHHAMRWSVRSVDTLEGTGPFALTYATEGMQTLLASLTPAWATGGHEIEIDLGYLLTRYAGRVTFELTGFSESERDRAWGHALALSPAWRWRLSRALRFRLAGNFGYDFEERGEAVPTCREWLPGYCAEESYGADAGFSISFGAP